MKKELKYRIIDSASPDNGRSTAIEMECEYHAIDAWIPEFSESLILNDYSRVIQIIDNVLSLTYFPMIHGLERDSMDHLESLKRLVQDEYRERISKIEGWIQRVTGNRASEDVTYIRDYLKKKITEVSDLASVDLIPMGHDRNSHRIQQMGSIEDYFVNVSDESQRRILSYLTDQLTSKGPRNRIITFIKILRDELNVINRDFGDAHYTRLILNYLNKPFIRIHSSIHLRKEMQKYLPAFRSYPRLANSISL